MNFIWSQVYLGNFIIGLSDFEVKKIFFSAIADYSFILHKKKSGGDIAPQHQVEICTVENCNLGATFRFIFVIFLRCMCF